MRRREAGAEGEGSRTTRFAPAPILFALMLNEVMRTSFKRIVQTISYLPHFISWVVVTGLISALFGTSEGLVTEWLRNEN